MKQYIVDTFANELFTGNPAAICMCGQWPENKLMLSIARENQMLETAFVRQEGNKYQIRWFSQDGEHKLGGHATLAAAFVVFNFYEPDLACLTFQSASGDVVVRQDDELYEMDLPVFDMEPYPLTARIVQILGFTPVEVFKGRDLVCVMENADQVRTFQPDLKRISALDGQLFHITAPGQYADCVTRSFAPKCGIGEDQVCGTGHCHVVPYWAKRLHKDNITAYQYSSRGGTLACEIRQNRIILSGPAVLYSTSEIQVAA